MSSLGILIKDEKPITIGHGSSDDLDVRIGAKTKGCLIIKANSIGSINLSLEEMSSLEVYLCPDGIDDPLVLQRVRGTLDKDSRLKLVDMAWSVHAQKRLIDIELLGRRSAISYYGLDRLAGEAKKDTRLTIYHKGEETKSEQSFRGVYSGKAIGCFLGKVIVERGACKSEAKQFYKSLLLESGACASTRPELEIYNDDVLASHGATIGGLDADALFYLCSRGLSESGAKSLLLRCFLDDVIGHIGQAAIRDELWREVDRLDGLSGNGL